MLATMRRASAVLAAAAALVLCAALPAFAQVATGTAGGTGSTVETTGPGGSLTLGTSSTGAFTGSGGGGDEGELVEEPLPHTGGGDVAFAAASLLAAGGLGLRWLAVRRR